MTRANDYLEQINDTHDTSPLPCPHCGVRKYRQGGPVPGGVLVWCADCGGCWVRTKAPPYRLVPTPEQK